MRSFKIKPRSSRVFLVACFLSHQGTFREGSWRFCSIPRTSGPPPSSPRLCGIFHSRTLLPFLLIPTICEDLEDVFLLFSTASFSKNCTFKKKKIRVPSVFMKPCAYSSSNNNLLTWNEMRSWPNLCKSGRSEQRDNQGQGRNASVTC